MLPDLSHGMAAALLLAWLLRVVAGRQWVAEAAELPARRCAREAARSGPSVGALLTTAAVLWGAVLGTVAGWLPVLLNGLLAEAPLAQSSSVVFGLQVLVLLGVLRVPRRGDATPEVLARQTVTPCLLFLFVGPWTAYAYRAAATFHEEGPEQPVLAWLLLLCDLLPRRLVGLAAYATTFPAAEPEGAAAECRGSLRWGWIAVAALLAGGTALTLVLPLLRTEGFHACSEGIAYAHRLWALDRELHAGVLYPRLYRDFAWGFGYPFPNFYAPLSYYLAEVGRLAGLSYLGAVKALACAVFAGSFLTMFLWTRQSFGVAAALVGAAGYATSGYLLTDVYTRGDLAEALCLAWLPLCFWQVGAPENGRRSWHIVACAAAVALLTLTHNITAMLAMPALLAMALLPWRRGLRSWTALGGIVLGLGLACFFWLPALAEKRFASTEQMLEGGYSYAHHFVSPPALLSLTGEPFGFPVSSLYVEGGTIPFFFAVVALAGLSGGTALASRAGATLRWMVLLFVASVVMMLAVSRPLWDAVPLLAYVQFPWRSAVFTCLALSYLAAAGARMLLDARPSRALQGGVLFAAALTALPSLLVLMGDGEPAPHSPRLASAARLLCVLLLAMLCLWMLRQPSSAAWQRRWLATTGLTVSLALGVWQATLRCVTMPVPPDAFTLAAVHRLEADPQYVGTTARAEYLPRWAPRRRPAVPPGSLSASAGRVTGGDRPRGYRREWWLETPAPAEVTYGVFYFPGWQAWVDGRRVPTRPSAGGLLAWNVPAGRHRLTVDFVDTPVRQWAWAVSLLSLLAFLACCLAGASWRSRDQRSRGYSHQPRPRAEDAAC